LLIKPGELRVVRGPKENNFRPALDPLFRSAAFTYDGRVIGVVLSGLLDDGTHGLLQVKQQGGVTIAQSPEDAQQPSMPASAIAGVGVDHVLPAAEIGPMLNKLTQSAGPEAAKPRAEQLDVAEGVYTPLGEPGLQRPNSPFICPECGGALWEVRDGALTRYRCHVGHGFTADTLYALRDEEVEQALWTIVRLLEEQAELQDRMADRWQTPGDLGLRQRFQANADDRRYAARLVRHLLTGESIEEQKSVHGTEAVRHEYGV
jgi:two-component system chemotaxis response regulator CheB